MSGFRSFALTLSSILLLSACASQVPLESKAPISDAGSGVPVGSAAAPVTTTPTPASSPTPVSASSGPVSGDSSTASQIAAAKAALSAVKPSVYFDFDSFDIKPDAQPTVNAYASYVRIDPQARLIIEGNADERGTTEYNLALGQKRAEAVRKALSALGAQIERMESISNGEEKPRAKGSNEAAWKENRRADLLLR